MSNAPRIFLHKNDLPDNVTFKTSVAIDTETMGLLPHRDRLCVVQLSAGDGICHLVQFTKDAFKKPNTGKNLKALLLNESVQKIFHFARFDLAVLFRYLGVVCASVYCTKIASKLTRTYTDRHGLKDLCQDLLGVEISKQAQTSDWGQEELTPLQQQYAATDVLYLHKIKECFDSCLVREGRQELAQACFQFLPARAQLDLLGYENPDIFKH